MKGRCRLIALAATPLLLISSASAMARGIGGIVPDLPSAAGAAPMLASPGAPFADAAGLQYHGGPVLNSNRTHLVFWAPAESGLTFPPGYTELIERFLSQVAADSHHATNVYGVSGQYSDAQGPAAYASTYAGATLDSDPLPANGCQEPSTGPAWTVCLTDAQLQIELAQVITQDELPQGINDIYFVVLPEGLATCVDAGGSSCSLGGSATGFCGYHSQTTGGVLYAVIPYNAVPGHCQSDDPRPNANPADPAISTISHEHNETVTDPETDTAWVDAEGEEEADLCITSFGAALGGVGAAAWNESIDGGHYWLQEEWSNDSGGCEPEGQIDPVTATVPGRTRVGVAVGLSGRASAADGRIVAYTWFFGDGKVSHGRAVTHRWRRAGVYRVLLRSTDSFENWSFAQRTIRVLPALRAGHVR